MNDFRSLAFVDLETTGTGPKRDRITEVAIVRTEDGCVTERWSSLVDPCTPIPDQIQQLTGISDRMVAGAPRIEELLPEIERLLEGASMVAHNAKFDAGFLRHAFARLELPFDYPVLCTLRLSRALYPRHKRHNLDALISRFQLTVETRHRAMADAEVLPQLLQRMREEQGEALVTQKLAEQLKRESLPVHLDASLLERLPRGAGVYLFLGENDVPLYVGKSVDIRSRVLSHFSDAKRSDKELRMSQEVRDIDWISTGGDLGAQIKEAALVKDLNPIFNRRLRRHKSLFSWFWQFNAGDTPRIVDLAGGDAAHQSLQDHYGLFRNRNAADKALREAVAEHGLCLKVLGLETGRENSPCFGYQLKRCRGACVGEENRMQHALRMADALLPLKIATWPFAGAVGVVEENEAVELVQMLVLDQWRVLAVLEEGEVYDPDGGYEAQPLDLDTYKILQRFMKKAGSKNQSGLKIVPLSEIGLSA